MISIYIYTATIRRPNGIVADRSYWKKSMKNPEEIPLKEARRFISILVKHKDFVETIKNFNAKKKVNWLDEKNIDILGGYVYSCSYTLKPALRIVQKEGRRTLKPKLVY